MSKGRLTKQDLSTSLAQQIDDTAAQAQNLGTKTEELATQLAQNVESTFKPTVGKNLFNPANRLVGQTLSSSSTDYGGLLPLALYNVTEFIPLDEERVYTLSNPRNLCFYDEKKNAIPNSFVNNSGNPTITVTAPVTAKYVRATFHDNFLSTFQVEKGAIKTAYEPYKTEVAIISNQAPISERLSVLEKTYEFEQGLAFYKQGDLFKIRSSFDYSTDIVLAASKRDTQNQLFNFEGTWLVPKATTKNQISPTVVVGDLIHTANDDIAPIRTFYTVGANHGYFVAEITSTGKTTADIGSLWTDGTYQWILVNVSGSKLSLIPDYVVTDDVSNPVTLALPTVNLTHVSGAVNTGEISVTTKSTQQLYPSVNNRSIKLVMDNKEVVADGVYYGESFKVYESYNIIDYKALVDFIRANIGTYYGSKLDQIGGVVKMSIVYEFSKGGNCTVHHSIRALKKVSTLNIQLLQSQALSFTGNTLYQYLPNVKLKSGYDFKNLVDMTSYATSIIFSTADYVDTTIPPHRYVQWLMNGVNKKVGFTMGYVPDKAEGSNASRVVNSPNAWDLRSTKKNYPLMLNSRTLNAGDHFNIVGYRNYISPNTVKNATNINVVEVGNDAYIYIDYHTNVSYQSIDIPKHLGKAVTVLEKNADFNLHNSEVDADGVMFSVVNGYGYAVLKVS